MINFFCLFSLRAKQQNCKQNESNFEAEINEKVQKIHLVLVKCHFFKSKHTCHNFLCTLYYRVKKKIIIFAAIQILLLYFVLNFLVQLPANLVCQNLFLISKNSSNQGSFEKSY